MRRVLLYGILSTVLLAGCSENNVVPDSGLLQLSITDAPVDATNVQAVWITIESVELQLDGTWISTGLLEEPYKVNLLSLTNGQTDSFVPIEVPAGRYSNVRFMLDISVEGSHDSSDGCYIEFTDGSTAALFVPSGEQSGYKAIGNYEVTEGGLTSITADFDLRRSVVVKNGEYLLKPVLRLVEDAGAGAISVPVDDSIDCYDIIVFAYESGTYDPSEADDPIEGEVRFPNAVNSVKADSDGRYTIPFLASGSYDIVIACYNADTFVRVLNVVQNTEVKPTATAEAPPYPGFRKDYDFGSVSFAVRYIDPGSYYVGRTAGAYNYAANANVELTRGYWIGETEVTYELWYTVAQWAASNGYQDLNVYSSEGSNGTGGAAPTGTTQQPTASVSWIAAVAWANALSQYFGYTPAYYLDNEVIRHRLSTDEVNLVEYRAANNGFRLPTMAEFEIAARGGRPAMEAGSYGSTYPGTETAADAAWFAASSGDATHEVGQLAANELGLYDMFGNVWEQCWDSYGGVYPSSHSDPTGPDPIVNNGRYLGGGAYNGGTIGFSDDIWSNYLGVSSHWNIGFRIARSDDRETP